MQGNSLRTDSPRGDLSLAAAAIAAASAAAAFTAAVAAGGGGSSAAATATAATSVNLILLLLIVRGCFVTRFVVKLHPLPLIDSSLILQILAWLQAGALPNDHCVHSMV